MREDFGSAFLAVVFMLIIIPIIVLVVVMAIIKSKDNLHHEEQVKHTPTNNYHKTSSLDNIAKNKKEVSSRKRVDHPINNTTNKVVYNEPKVEEFQPINKPVINSDKREEELDDREMALAVSVEEIVKLKEKVDKIIKDQKEELFSYCSVSEESAMKMKEAILEVQKMLEETLEKIQEK